jgi:hypothetical protein
MKFSMIGQGKGDLLIQVIPPIPPASASPPLKPPSVSSVMAAVGDTTTRSRNTTGMTIFLT